MAGVFIDSFKWYGIRIETDKLPRRHGHGEMATTDTLALERRRTHCLGGFVHLFMDDFAEL